MQCFSKSSLKHQPVQRPRQPEFLKQQPRATFVDSATIAHSKRWLLATDLLTMLRQQDAAATGPTESLGFHVSGKERPCGRIDYSKHSQAVSMLLVMVIGQECLSQ